jgi:hypothetical protein
MKTKIILPSILGTAHITVYIERRQCQEFRASLTHKKSGDMLAYIGDTPADECHVRIDDRGHASLWIGRTAFDIPAQDAQRATDALEIRLVDEQTKGGA